MLVDVLVELVPLHGGIAVDIHLMRVPSCVTTSTSPALRWRKLALMRPRLLWPTHWRMETGDREELRAATASRTIYKTASRTIYKSCHRTMHACVHARDIRRAIWTSSVHTQPCVGKESRCTRALLWGVMQPRAEAKAQEGTCANSSHKLATRCFCSTPSWDKYFSMASTKASSSRPSSASINSFLMSARGGQHASQQGGSESAFFSQCTSSSLTLGAVSRVPCAPCVEQALCDT